MEFIPRASSFSDPHTTLPRCTVTHCTHTTHSRSHMPLLSSLPPSLPPSSTPPSSHPHILRPEADRQPGPPPPKPGPRPSLDPESHSALPVADPRLSFLLPLVERHPIVAGRSGCRVGSVRVFRRGVHLELHDQARCCRPSTRTTMPSAVTLPQAFKGGGSLAKTFLAPLSSTPHHHDETTTTRAETPTFWRPTTRQNYWLKHGAASCTQRLLGTRIGWASHLEHKKANPRKPFSTPSFPSVRR